MAVTDRLDLLRIIQNHVVIELRDLMDVRHHFTLLNIRVAGFQGVLHVHAAADGGPAGFGDGDNEGVFSLAQLLPGHVSRDHGGCVLRERFQGSHVPLADDVHHHLLNCQGIVKHFGVRLGLLKPLLGTALFQPEKVFSAFDQVVQPQLFPVDDKIEKAQHLDQAFQGQPGDLLHAGKKLCQIVRRHVQFKRDFAQLLILRRGLPGGPHHHPAPPAADHAVHVEPFGDVKPHVPVNGRNLRPHQQDRIPGKRRHAEMRQQPVPLVETNGKAGQISRHSADINQIVPFHFTSPLPIYQVETIINDTRQICNTSPGSSC